jgi:predicted metal-binding membrane protein
MASGSAVVRADRGAALVFAAAAAALAWALVGHHAAAPGFASAFTMWNVMMVAMMLPSLLPWLVLFERERLPLFLAGYFAVWALYCVAAAGAQIALRERLLLDEGLALAPRAGGALLVAAGLYELTPLKRSCLRRCRSPLGRLLTRWRSGRGWALRVGLEHGLECLGCCWALMAIAFSLGVMSLGGMAALTLVLLAEKTAPWGERVSPWLAAALALWGATLVVVPSGPS